MANKEEMDRELETIRQELLSGSYKRLPVRLPPREPRTIKHYLRTSRMSSMPPMAFMGALRCERVSMYEKNVSIFMGTGQNC